MHGEIETINKLNASWYVLRHNAQIIREEHFGYGHNGAWLLKSRWSYAPDIQIGRDFDTLLIEAKAGDLRAQVDVGLAYENGTGVSQDSNEAVKWYIESAKQGNPPAQVNIGRCYLQGIGVSKDPSKAADSYLKAAEQGWPSGQFSIACMYEDGLGVPKSNQKAADWYRKAAIRGHTDARYNLGCMYRDSIFKALPGLENIPIAEREKFSWLMNE